MKIGTTIKNVASLRSLVLLLVLVLLAPFYVTSLQAPAVGHFHDDGIYLVTAKALAEGQGYRLLHLPEQPYQTKYPILLPALLAWLWAVHPEFPNNVILLKMVPFIAALAWLLVSRRLLRFRAHAAATPIVLLVAATPLSVFLATSLVAESLLAVLATSSLLWLDKTQSKSSGNREVAIAAMFAALAFNAKTIGIVSVVTGAAILLIWRRYRHCAVYALVSGVLCVPWLTWQFANSNAASVDAYNSLSNYYKDWTILGRSLQEQVSVVIGNVIQIGFAPLPLTGSSPRIAGVLLCLVFTAFTVWGFASDLRRRGVQSDHIYCGLYLGLIVSWPWPPLRFLWSILPLVLYYTYCGLSRVWTHAPTAAGVVTAVCLGLALPVQQQAIREAASPALGIGPLQIRWGDFLRAAAAIKERTAPHDRILSILEPTVYLLTGRQGVRGFSADPIKLFYTRDKDRALGSVHDFETLVRDRGITHILDMPSGLFAEGPMLSAVINEFVARNHYRADVIVDAAPGFRLISLHESRTTIRW